MKPGEAGERFAVMLAAMPTSERDRVVVSLLEGALRASMHSPNGVADLIGKALGAWGVVVLLINGDGVKLHDGWDDHGPRGAEVSRIMDRVHVALTAIIDAEFTRIDETTKARLS